MSKHKTDLFNIHTEFGLSDEGEVNWAFKIIEFDPKEVNQTLTSEKILGVLDTRHAEILGQFYSDDDIPGEITIGYARGTRMYDEVIGSPVEHSEHSRVLTFLIRNSIVLNKEVENAL